MGTSKANRQRRNDLSEVIMTFAFVFLLTCGRSGDKYEGEFLAGFRDGYGTMVKKSGDKYEVRCALQYLYIT